MNERELCHAIEDCVARNELPESEKLDRIAEAMRARQSVVTATQRLGEAQARLYQ